MLIDDFNLDVLADYEIIRKRVNKKGGRDYLDCVCAFDIESSRLPEIEQSVMYIWQMQIEQYTITGRSWEEFFTFLQRIRERLEKSCWIVVYVHNLSYEFQFLKGLYGFQKDEVFAMDSRKVLKCEMYGCIEFRCSYLLTNMTLDRFLKKYNVENKKLDDFDYAKIRYPWTPLSAREMEYCINDVKGLVQAVRAEMRSNGDDLSTIPLTSTGYVRRDAKKAMQTFNHNQLQDMLPDAEVYRLLREAFRGGDTLANRWNADSIIEDVQSVDIVSSYPASMLTRKFPSTRFYREDPDRFDKLYRMRSKALLFRVTFFNIRLKTITEGHAYLSRDKCRDIVQGTYCNGRILKAARLDTTITDVDFNIISRRYCWDDMIVSDLFSSRYRMLPFCLRAVIMKYYRIKTELRGVPEDSEDYLVYMNNKARLNAVYGMTVEDPCKDEIDFIDGDFVQRDEPLEKLLKRHNRSAFLNYAWGIWTTAWSRMLLADGIDAITQKGKCPANFVYSDTDSIKYVGDPNIDALNSQLEALALHSRAYAADSNGEVHYMGVYESEHYRLPNRFKTLGAKKYVLEDPDRKLHITIAGVNKRKGGEELGKLENFREGFIFKEAGGTESVFNDNIDMTIQREGHALHISDNVVIRDSTYTLGITAEYRAILDGLVQIRYSDQDIYGLYKVKL